MTSIHNLMNSKVAAQLFFLTSCNKCTFTGLIHISLFTQVSERGDYNIYESLTTLYYILNVAI